MYSNGTPKMTVVQMTVLENDNRTVRLENGSTKTLKMKKVNLRTICLHHHNLFWFECKHKIFQKVIVTTLPIVLTPI